jgi:hypothetical protein
MFSYSINGLLKATPAHYFIFLEARSLKSVIETYTQGVSRAVFPLEGLRG